MRVVNAGPPRLLCEDGVGQRAGSPKALPAGELDLRLLSSLFPHLTSGTQVKVNVLDGVSSALVLGTHFSKAAETRTFTADTSL